MQSSKMMWNFPLTVHLQVVMIFIPNDQKRLDFCINPSHETLVETYTKEGFMQNQHMIWNLSLHIVWYVVMTFITNYKEMSRHLLFSTFA